MTDLPPGGIVFDLDGTLVDTSHDLIEAANRVLLSLGLDVRIDPVQDRAEAFNGGRALLELGFSRLRNENDASCSHEMPHSHEVLYGRYIEEYEKRVDVHSRAYAGVEATLQALAMQGWRLGVCTNKPENPARTLLTTLDLIGYFDVIVGADTHPFRKPDPRVYHQTVMGMEVACPASIMIGDSWTDADVARHAGVPFVLYEPEAPEDLRNAVDRNRRFADFESLPSLVERLRAQRMDAA